VTVELHALLYPWKRACSTLMIDGEPQSQSGCGGEEKYNCPGQEYNPSHPACSQSL